MADEEDSTPACSQWILPCKEFHGLWESLIYEDFIQHQILDYAETTMLFSDKGVNSQLINWNRVILMTGPPGTGKTSLCKAVSQKLAIRLQQRYSQGQLIEINAHSLFSKWFSESGKLVLKLFSKIQEMIEDEDAFICVLIDEVESLTSARKSAMNGNEPSDAIRVVNAVLTQIDKLKQYKNVLILATSNIAQAIDLAFIDRADVKFFIGNPGLQARYQILKSCIDELCRVDIISTTQDNYLSDQFDTQNSSNNNELTNKLIKICEACSGLSGRNLRKLPFLAHTFFIKSPQISLDNYLNALYHAVEKESLLRKKLQEETL